MSQNQAWSQFWQQGYTTSFADDLPQNYQGSIKAYWQSTVENLPENGAILDIATGNGAIALIIAEAAKNQGKILTIHAIDAANIAPQASSENPEIQELLSSIKFHPQTKIESLNLQRDVQFDLITSQFGVEYSQIAPAISAITQHLKPGGTFRSICHYIESPTYKYCLDDNNAYSLAIDKLKIPSLLEQFLVSLGEIGNMAELEKALARPALQPELTTLIDSIKELISLHGQSSVSAFISKSVESFLSNNLVSPLKAKTTFSRTFSDALTAGQKRIQSQLESTLDPQTVAEVERLITENNLQLVNSSEFLDQDKVIGWNFEAKKPNN